MTKSKLGLKDLLFQLLGRLRQEDPQIKGLLRLQSEFKASLGN